MKLKIFVFSLVISLFLTSCDYDKPYIPNPDPKLVDVVYEKEFTAQDLFEILISYAGEEASMLPKLFEEFLPSVMQNSFKAVILTYNTVDPYGKPVVASGSFFYPAKGADKSKGILEITPVAQTDRYHSLAVSVMKNLEDMDVVDKRVWGFVMPALLNYIVLYPDCIGGGVAEAMNYQVPWLHPTNYGEVFLDFREAVEEYLYQKESYILPQKSTLMGYSLGGSTSLTVAQYYYLHSDIFVDKIYTGGGLYDVILGLEKFKEWGTCGFAAIPAVFTSMNEYNNLNLDFSKVFAGGLENSVDSPNAEEGGDGYAYWFNNTKDSEVLMQRWGQDLHKYMHPSFFDPGFTGEFAKIKDIAKELNVVDNCKINRNTQIFLFHSNVDNVIPYQCALELYEKWKDNYNISFFTLTGDHFECAMYFILSVSALLL